MCLSHVKRHLTFIRIGYGKVFQTGLNEVSVILSIMGYHAKGRKFPLK
jgi:hypothetical protein